MCKILEYSLNPHLTPKNNMAWWINSLRNEGVIIYMGTFLMIISNNIWWSKRVFWFGYLSLNPPKNAIPGHFFTFNCLIIIHNSPLDIIRSYGMVIDMQAGYISWKCWRVNIVAPKNWCCLSSNFQKIISIRLKSSKKYTSDHSYEVIT